jgi:hypothetical protein
MELPNRPFKEGDEIKNENVLLDFIFYGIIPWVLFVLIFFYNLLLNICKCKIIFLSLYC